MDKTNPRTEDLIQKMYKLSEENGVNLWKDLAGALEKSGNNWVEINLDHLNKVTEKGDKVVVPGKVLGKGLIDHEVDVYSFNSSKVAKKRIVKEGGSCLPIEELMDRNPQASGVKIIK